MQNLFPGMTTPEPGLVPCIKKLLPESISDSSLLSKLFFQFPLPTANTEQKSIGIFKNKFYNKKRENLLFSPSFYTAKKQPLRFPGTAGLSAYLTQAPITALIRRTPRLELSSF